MRDVLAAIADYPFVSLFLALFVLCCLGLLKDIVHRG